MKRPFFACISIQFQKPATVYVCNSETGYYISGPFELRNLNSSLLRGGVDGCFSLDGKHILVRCCSDAALFCHAVVWDIAKGEEELRALISCSSIVVGIREELHQCIG